VNRTSIEWTTFSANPLKYRDGAGNVVWGCVHASPGCQHCYSEQLAKRYGRGGPFNVPTMNGLTPFLDDVELHKMRTAKQVGGVAVSGSRCFIGDMTDIFGEWVPDDLLNRLFSNVLEIRTDVTWQLLTKRADRMRQYLSWRYGEGRIPSRNIHVGVSIEDQPRYDQRIGHLLRTPAAVRFISYEPALGPLSSARRLVCLCSINKEARRIAARTTARADVSSACLPIFRSGRFQMPRDPEKAKARKKRYLDRKKVEKYGPDSIGRNMSGRHGNHARGQRNGRWNADGRMLNEDGYVKIRVGRDHPLSDPNGYAYEHLVVWCAAGNKRPGVDETLHHKNDDKTDNRLSNLELLTRPNHARIHAAERGRDDLGRFPPGEVRA